MDCQMIKLLTFSSDGVREERMIDRMAPEVGEVLTFGSEAATVTIVYPPDETTGLVTVVAKYEGAEAT